VRRRRHSDQLNGDSEINLTPMLDIVFIMLIFFVVTTSFVKESGIDVNRPSAQTAEPRDQGNILIAITPNGEIWIDKRPVDIRAIRAVVERLVAENPEGGVIIQGDREAEIGLLVKVMDQVRKAGVKNVSIAASKDK
jgi:biopolymer transport protein ExbD